jgi:hypothetical protein
VIVTPMPGEGNGDAVMVYLLDGARRVTSIGFAPLDAVEAAVLPLLPEAVASTGALGGAEGTRRILSGIAVALAPERLAEDPAQVPVYATCAR